MSSANTTEYFKESRAGKHNDVSTTFLSTTEGRTRLRPSVADPTSSPNATVLRTSALGSTCFMCGNKGHYARDCQNDENWRQEVDNGCWTFWYCGDCGKEFTEETEYESHTKCCQST